jgi:prepilin-type N-terminal cleavage/methylation domain-containing protein
MLAAAGRENGFTLVELLVSMMLGLMVVGTGVMVFSASVHTQPEQRARGGSIQQARTTLERITREIRQGWDVLTATSQQLTLLTYVKSVTCGGAPGTTAIPCRVSYTCTAGSCIRVESLPNGSSPGPAVTVVTGLSSVMVFGYSPSASSPTNVNVTLSFPAATGDDAITVEDGATLRNPS